MATCGVAAYAAQARPNLCSDAGEMNQSADGALSMSSGAATLPRRRQIMKSFHDVVTLARVRRLLVASISVLTLGGSAPASAQTAPPVQGTIALQATMKKVYQAANVVIVTTIDGVDHAYHFAKDLVVHGGKKGVDPFEGLREGATVVVHYTVEGTEATVHEIDRIDVEGLETTEGTVTQIDRGRT